MSFVLRGDGRGILTLEIELPKGGEVISYTVALAPPGLSLWAVDLANLANGEVYRVGLEVGGWWRCNCPDYHFHKANGRERFCKHARSVRAIYGFLQSMRGNGHEQRSPAPERKRVGAAG